MKEYSDATLAVLRHIIAHYGATIPEIDHLADGKGKTTMENLCARGMCNSIKRDGLRVYTATRAGQRLVEDADWRPDAMATPRMLPTAPYVPAKTAPTRPGAMDAYALPSLDGGRQIERRAPGIMSSRIAGAYLR